MANKGATKSGGTTIPAWWVEVARIPKTLLSWPAWSEPVPKAGKAKGGLETMVAETTQVVIPLGNKEGVGLQGVQLRMDAWAYKRLHEVTAILEVSGGGRPTPIARVDAWPAACHGNAIVRTVPKLKAAGIPLQIDGCHIHRFRDNARVGRKAFEPSYNLPVAVPVPEALTSFRGFLRTVASEFVIIGLEDFDPPAWQEWLL